MAMHHQIIQHKKFCLNKYLLIENQVQEEENVKMFIKCYDKRNQIKNGVFVMLKCWVIVPWYYSIDTIF